MTNPAKSASQPVVVVYGLGANGRAKAGRFKASDAVAVRKAAAELGLAVTEIAASAGRALAARIPMGRIGASADRLVPFVSKELFEQIKSLDPQQRKNGSDENQPPTTISASAVKIRLPKDWDDIKVGDLVLATDEDPAEGFWQCTVIEATRKILKLKWPRERGRPFQRHRSMVGLICPGEITAETKLDIKQSPSEPDTVYPRHWSEIGLNQIVLAIEDGPCQQAWIAKTIKIEKDLFTLQWRDHPHLPMILRPRSALGLLHPAPKTR